MLHLERGYTRLAISEVSPSGFRLPLAQTHQKLGLKAIFFFLRKGSNFLETYFRTRIPMFIIRVLRKGIMYGVFFVTSKYL